MNSIIAALKRILLAIILITITNMLFNNIINYSLFNIGFVAVFTFPGIVILFIMMYFIKN